MFETIEELRQSREYLCLSESEQSQIEKGVQLRLSVSSLTWLLGKNLTPQKRHLAITLFADGISEAKVGLLSLFNLNEGTLRRMAESLKRYSDAEIIEISNSIAEFYKDQVQFIMALLYKGIDYDDIKPFATDKYDKLQMSEISDGIANGLILEQVKMYADKNLDADKMNQVRESLENGLTMSQITFMLSENFDSYQMFSIRKGFESGLPLEKVGIYAQKHISGENMEHMRHSIGEQYF